jgi:hypothetical protein
MDVKADGAFGGLTNHRAGYGDDRLARLIDWLRAHPTATLASGEGALLLGEIDQLRHRADRTERILAALREPSEGVVEAALNEYDRRYSHGPLSMRLTRHEPYHRASLTESLSAAVAAAEQEVVRE